MKHEVLKPFLSLETGRIVNPGDVVSIPDESRAKDLERNGLVRKAAEKAVHAAPATKDAAKQRSTK